MKREFFFVLLVCIAICIYYVDAFNKSNVQNNIKYINSVQSSWKAGNSPLSRFSLKEWKKKLGIRLIPKKLKLLKKSFVNKFLFTARSNGSNLPENFDSREAWPACKSMISSIRDQSTCGSCWAVASASVVSDRNCIATRGAFNQPLSAEDMMRCCHKCKVENDNGCEGGDIVEATYFLIREGIVTGGDYNSEQGCMPYSFAPCSPVDLKNGITTCAYVEKGVKTEQCLKKCSNLGYETLYTSDKHRIDNAVLLRSREKDIKEELMTRGSCLATMEVYEDFMHYKSGVYQRVRGRYLGYHGVRLIGWGVKNKIKYWLVANSWSESWGEKGIFKVHQTKSKCNFAKYIICPYPRL